MVTGQKPYPHPTISPLWIIEEIIAKYAVDANLSRLGSTIPPKKRQPVFFVFYTGAFDLEPLFWRHHAIYLEYGTFA